MAERGHKCYLLYKAGTPAYLINENVKLLPYDTIDEVKGRLLEFRPDVYFCFSFNRQLLNYYKQSIGTGVPFGFQECTNPHRLIYNNWKIKSKLLPDYIALWEREILASAAARIRVVMPSYVSSFPEYLRFKVRGFPNASFVNMSELEGEISHEQYIISVNGMKANKNMLTLIKAFHLLLKTHPTLKLIDIGKGPEGLEAHKKEIIDYIKLNNLSDNVIFVGPVDNPLNYLKNSLFHVIASLSEGCPTVVLEAMAVGIPSVGFEDCPGTNELITHERNGILVSSNNRVDSLMRGMRRLLNNPRLIKRLGKQALLDSESYTVKSVYDQWEKLFLEMASYKYKPNRIFDEQFFNSPERALHAERMKNRLSSAFDLQ